MFIPIHGLPSLTFQQHGTYGIMNGHMNACSCHQKQETNIKS